MGLERVFIEAVNPSANLQPVSHLAIARSNFKVHHLTPEYCPTHFPVSTSMPNPIKPMSLR